MMEESVLLKTLSQISSTSTSPSELHVLENLSAAVAHKISGGSEDDDDDYFTFRVPKYFQALFTLFVCFSLLLCTLTLIRQTKKFCQKSACTKKVPLVRIDSDKGQPSQHPQRIVVSTIEGQVQGQGQGQGQGHNQGQRPPTPTPRHFDYYTAPISADQPPRVHTKADENNFLKVKKVRFVRRVSGPFGDDALDFVGQTYKKKVKEVKQVERLGQVPGRIKTHQSVRKQSRANANHTPTPSPQPPQV